MFSSLGKQCRKITEENELLFGKTQIFFGKNKAGCDRKAFLFYSIILRGFNFLCKGKVII